MKGSMRGLMLFLRYVCPCLENKLSPNKLSKEDKELILSWASGEQEINPGRAKMILARHFAYPYSGLVELASRAGRNYPFAFGNVADYWRNHHCNHFSPTLTITIPDSGHFRVIRTTEAKDHPHKLIVMREKGVFIDLFGFDVRPGDIFYVHGSHLIEKKSIAPA